MDKDLKIFALEYVKLHDRLLKEQKLAIGQFIMEASDDQVSYMLLTGEVKDKLNEKDLLYIKEIDMNVMPGANMDQKTAFGAGLGSGLAAAAYTAMIVVGAVKAYKRFLSKAARSCSGKSGHEKTSCMNKFKKQAQVAKVKALQGGMGKCAKTKDPTSCKSKLQAKINKEKAKMGAL
jgi:hypothetical protein